MRRSILRFWVLSISSLLSLGLWAAPAGAAPLSTWEALAECESSGRWHINTGNGYYGGLQFYDPTWDSFRNGQFAHRADLASKRQQIIVAERVLKVQGWDAWPVCSRRIGVR